MDLGVDPSVREIPGHGMTRLMMAANSTDVFAARS